MPLYLFYTMVQKSQKWPKTQIKGGPALKEYNFSKLVAKFFIFEKLPDKNGGYSSKVRAQKGGGHRKAREPLSA